MIIKQDVIMFQNFNDKRCVKNYFITIAKF
jgi:hypothetical protein